MWKWQKRSVWADPRFQLKYTAGIVVVAAAILVVLGALYVRTLAEQRRLVGVNRVCLGLAREGASPEDAEFDADLASRLEQADTRNTLLLVGAAALLVTALAVLGVRLTYHVVGPARAVSGMLWRMSEGHMMPPRHLRGGDEFEFLEDDLGKLQEALAREAAEDCARLSEAAAALRAGGGPAAADAVAAIEARIATKRERYRLGPGPGFAIPASGT
jgi:hypothetical protein